MELLERDADLRALASAREEATGGQGRIALISGEAGIGEQHQFFEAERHLVEGIAYAADRDLDRSSHYMGSWLPVTHLCRGRWNEACDIATSLVERPNIATIKQDRSLGCTRPLARQAW